MTDEWRHPERVIPASAAQPAPGIVPAEDVLTEPGLPQRAADWLRGRTWDLLVEVAGRLTDALDQRRRRRDRAAARFWVELAKETRDLRAALSAFDELTFPVRFPKHAELLGLEHQARDRAAP